MNLNETTNGLNNNTANTQDTADSKDTQTTLNKTYSVGEVNGLLTAFWQFINSCNMTNNRTALNDTVKPGLDNICNSLDRNVAPNLQGIIEAIKTASGMKTEDPRLSFVHPYADKESEKNSLVSSTDPECIEAGKRLATVYSKDLENIHDALHYSGVYFSGPAGIGKGYIAENFGEYLLKDGYNAYRNYFVTLSETTNPATITYGSLVNGKECIGLIPEAFKYANDHTDVAVVIILDEINRCDYLAMLSNVFQLLSHKQTRKDDPDTSSMTLLDGTTIRYTSNIYIIATGNTGAKFRNGDANLSDAGFADRFTKIDITGVFASPARVDEYFKYVEDNNLSKLSTEELNDVRDSLKEDIERHNEDNPKNKWNGVVSYRELNRLMATAKDGTDLYDALSKYCGLDSDTVRGILNNE